MTNYHVEFPGLGWEFDISPVAFTIGGFSVYWYGIIIAVGFVLAVVYGMKNAKRFNVNEDKLTNCVIVGLIAAVVGARLYFVAFSWDSFKDNPSRVFNIHEGGLAIYGGLIGAVAGGLSVAKIQKMKLLPVLDVAVLGFLIGQGIGRWGNFMNQEAFGSQTDLPWRMVSQGTGGVGVHPCFFYESVWCLTGFVLLHFFSVKYRRYDGQMFFLYLVWYGFERMLVEGLRSDSLYLPFGNIRVSQLLSFLLFVTGCVMLIINRKKQFENDKISEKASV
ncbi:MAG: prolipoprotein diacylglyceryl transferase [Clostridia bacterium]|nr:prolipoprotein diacylglyceryl transferase [Clostridia bacterium]